MLGYVIISHENLQNINCNVFMLVHTISFHRLTCTNVTESATLCGFPHLELENRFQLLFCWIQFSRMPKSSRGSGFPTGVTFGIFLSRQTLAETGTQFQVFCPVFFVLPERDLQISLLHIISLCHIPVIGREQDSNHEMWGSHSSVGKNSSLSFGI